MPPIEIGPVRPAGAIDRNQARETRHEANRAAAGRPAVHGAVVRRAGGNPGPEPVDAARVEEIRKAVEQGTYPVLPARIADAMIAAGHLLRTGK